MQAGLGRCGSYWAIDTYGAVSDIMVTAKGLSGGLYPITATLCRDGLNRFMHENPFMHVSAFGGAELGCRVALKILDILESPGFLERVRKSARVFADGFAELRRGHPEVLAETRQRGLMMGLKMRDAASGPLMTVAGFGHGILTVYANHDTSVSQILPPLIITQSEASEVLERLDAMLGWVGERLE